MKAVVVTQPGGPEVLQVQERPVPEAGPGQVLIRVKAAGINRPDVAQRKGKYPAPPDVPPDVPGLEVAGSVEVCGPGVTRWQAGDKVCALAGGGGYAQYLAVDEKHCLPVPGGWSFEEAASLPETVFTVWHNVFQRGGLRSKEDFLVHGGSSGIGITAIQLAKARGARVFATAGTEVKCLACEELGAEKCINYTLFDFEDSLSKVGLDVILDMVGGEYIPKNIRLLRPDGRLVFINAIKGGKGDFDALDLMRRRLTLTGSTLRPRDAEFKAALAAEVEKNVWPVIAAGQFKAVVYKVFDMENASSAHALMESSQHIGKIVLRME
jgi:putative PIG3 family NAD(P)H quinone oxidoreductase